MFWVELTGEENGTILLNLESVVAIRTLLERRGMTVLSTDDGRSWTVRETPEQIKSLLPFVRRVGEELKTLAAAGA